MYDTFELDCGCRMHCKCNARRDEERYRLRRRVARLEAELRGDHERCPNCMGRGSFSRGEGFFRHPVICPRCDGTTTIPVVA